MVMVQIAMAQLSKDDEKGGLRVAADAIDALYRRPLEPDPDEATLH